MELKKISKLNFWQWFGICLVGLIIISSHQFYELSKIKNPVALLVLSGVFIALAAMLAFFLKWYYSRNRMSKIFSKRPFRQLINAGFQITEDHVTGTVDGYTCKVGLSFVSVHLMESIWYELYFINPYKNQEDWKRTLEALRRKSSRKIEWQYNKIIHGYVTQIRRVSFDKLMTDMRQTIELMQFHNLKAK